MTLALLALGVHVALEVEDPVLRAQAAHVLADLGRPLQPPRAGDPQVALTVSGSGPWTTRSPAHCSCVTTREDALASVLTAVNLNAVSATPLLAFHAAVVARDERTLVLPGASGLGKSTLTSCLLRAGWSYVSDEALALQWSDGVLRGYPRPLSLSPWSATVVGAHGVLAGGEHVLRAADLQAPVRTDPARVTEVVLLERGPADALPTVRCTDRNEALAELLQRGFTHLRDGARTLVLLAALLQAADVVRLRLGDPHVAARLLTDAGWSRPAAH